jgi:23S rRNA pseudouridine955/2504/2580 synthase
VHLSSIGHPIIADDLYNGQSLYLSSLKKHYNSKQGIEKPLIQRAALHARKIEFAGMDGNVISLTAEYPKDLAVAVKQLEKYAGF